MPALAAAGALALVLGMAPLTSGAQTPPDPGDVGTQAPGGQVDTAQNADSPIAFERQAGATRYQTAAEIATARFDAATDVVIATGEDYADALAGAALEGDLAAPVLLVPSNLVNGTIPSAITDAIDELGATSATLLGGEDAISADVVDDIEANSTVVTTERVEGATRFETAEEIATEVAANPVPEALSDHLGLGGDVAFVATGLEFADALAAGAGAYEGPHPILLTGPDELHPAAARGLEASGADSVIILGGTDAVGEAVATELDDAGYDTGRLAGADRWATATAVADAFADGYGFGVADVGLATGFEFADALASAPYLGEVPAPVVLTPGSSVNDQPESWFDERGCDIDTIHVFGGQVAVQDAVAESYAETACPGDGEVDTLELTPESATNPHSGQLDGDDGQPHQVSASVTDATGAPVDGVDVLFEVYEDTAAGDAAVLQPVGETAVVSTDVDGVAEWSYDGPDSERADLIVACTPEGSATSCTDGPDLLRDAGTGELTNLQHDPSDTAEKAWVARELETLQIQPETAVNGLGDAHEVTATGQDQFGDVFPLDEWDGVDGDRVAFEVYEGSDGAFADTGDGADVAVDGDGEAVHSYTGPNADRDDLIVACLVGEDETIGDVDCAELDGGGLTLDDDRLTATAEKAWRELISLSADPVELDAGGGEHSVITATVTDASGDPVEGVDVEFTNDGDGDFVEGATVTEATDAGGDATVVYETVASDDGQVIEVTGTEQLNGASDTASAGVGVKIAAASGNFVLDQVDVAYTADIAFSSISPDFLDQFTYTDADGNEATPTGLGGSTDDTITLNFAAGVVEAADDGDADLEYMEGAHPVEADTSGVNARTPDGVADMPVN